MKIMNARFKMVLLMKFFLSSYLHAYDFIPCNSEQLHGCVSEILSSINIRHYEYCNLEQVYFGKESVTQDEFYVLTCPYDKLFFKQSKNTFQNNNVIINYLLQNCLSNLCSSLVKPIAEVHALNKTSPAHYLVYPHINGDTLSTLKEQMFQGELNKGRLNILYRTIGLTLGTMHKSGVSEEVDDFISLKSHLVHGDLHSSNIIIKSNNNIHFVDIDGLSESLKEPQYLTKDIHSVTLQVLPTHILLLDDPSLAAWVVAIPEFVNSFTEGYCSSMSAIEYNHCDSQIRNYIIMLLKKTYRSFLAKDNLASDDELEPVYINSYVLENRLRQLL
ncbi:hypothetical protein NX722_15940 [Endozoicomonas gorgoniicola]|uniref:Aminoglycoside phosphotransferase domain-containing protein n=1 Tax=Endozoicomonas gorgoniicola TaxID=1234144 RepID=A0ABT3MXH1_9GAMM|nr:hypothetical protein [Endozoicomonas gorgoniicola]MCW7554081.1 hypothetical protein [Endozoicomonas gorgoniicola]